jgi:hypothetical protein
MATVDEDLQVVRTFVEKRNLKDVAGAMEFLTPNAFLGSPWGYHTGKEKIERFLKHEGSFLSRTYLDPSIAISKIDDGTYQRVYRYQSHMGAYRGPGLLNVFGGVKYRELYFVKDGKIRLVTCFKQYTT